MKKIKSIAVHIYYNLNLRSKLLVSYLVLILIPIIMIVLLTSSNMKKSLIMQAGNAYLQTIKQANINISYGLEEAYGITDYIQNSYEIQSILRDVSSREITTAEEIDFFYELNRNIYLMETKKNIRCVNFYMNGYPLFANANSSFGRTDLLKKEDILTPLFTGELNKMWINASELKHTQGLKTDSVVFIKEIRDTFTNGAVLGYILIEIDTSFIWKTFRNIGLPDDMGIHITKQGSSVATPVNSSNKQLVSTYIKTKIPIDQSIIKYRGGMLPFYAINSSIGELNWDVSILTSESNLTINSRLINNFMILVAVIICVLAIISAMFIANTITKRLKDLIANFKQAGKGKFTEIEGIIGNDEISQLQYSYNKMNRKIDDLIKQVYQEKISKQQAEMKLLYAQINPHFVYNTLDIIKWSAVTIKADSIVYITESLAKFLRLSLNDGKDTISISNEIEEVLEYMRIINYRYKDSISLVVNVQADLKDVIIIKMILQPLVENSVVHGIFEKDNKCGTIWINVYRNDDYIVFEVKDDGVGIKATKIGTILEDESSGYGVKNVHNRIKVYFGEQSGLEYEKNTKSGCCVRVNLKLSKTIIPNENDY